MIFLYIKSGAKVSLFGKKSITFMEMKIYEESKDYGSAAVAVR